MALVPEVLPSCSVPPAARVSRRRTTYSSRKAVCPQYVSVAGRPLGRVHLSCPSFALRSLDVLGGAAVATAACRHTVRGNYCRHRRRLVSRTSVASHNAKGVRGIMAKVFASASRLVAVVSGRLRLAGNNAANDVAPGPIIGSRDSCVRPSMAAALSRPPLVDPPELPPASAARLDDLLQAFPSAYRPLKMTGPEREDEYKRYFQPLNTNPKYGELDQAGVARVLCAARLGPDDAFVDVGSGFGKLVVLAAHMTNVGSAWGLELSPTRAQEALHGADALLEAGALSATERERINLLQGNCGADAPPDVLDATHFLLAIKGDGGEQVERLISAVQQRLTPKSRPRVLWTVTKTLRFRPGLVRQRTWTIPGIVRPPGNWAPPPSIRKKRAEKFRNHSGEGKWRKSKHRMNVHEYILGPISTPRSVAVSMESCL